MSGSSGHSSAISSAVLTLLTPSGGGQRHSSKTMVEAMHRPPVVNMMRSTVMLWATAECQPRSYQCRVA